VTRDEFEQHAAELREDMVDYARRRLAESDRKREPSPDQAEDAVDTALADLLSSKSYETCGSAPDEAKKYIRQTVKFRILRLLKARTVARRRFRNLPVGTDDRWDDEAERADTSDRLIVQEAIAASAPFPRLDDREKPFVSDNEPSRSAPNKKKHQLEAQHSTRVDIERALRKMPPATVEALIRVVVFEEPLDAVAREIGEHRVVLGLQIHSCLTELQKELEDYRPAPLLRTCDAALASDRYTRRWGQDVRAEYRRACRRVDSFRFWNPG
jgi:DNA-directed RNA polymerase specialized sigma24 family protein